MLCFLIYPYLVASLNIVTQRIETRFHDLEDLRDLIQFLLATQRFQRQTLSLSNTPQHTKPHRIG